MATTDLGDGRVIKQADARPGAFFITTPVTAPTFEYVIIKNVLSSGSNDDTTVAAGYQQRKLNTLENPLGVSWASLASNQFTLQAGTYLIDGSFPATGENDTETNHKAKLRNFTDSTDAIIGTAELSSLLVVGATAGGTPSATRSLIQGSLVIVSAKTFEVQHQLSNTGSGTSFGFAATFGDSEVYAVLNITRIQS